MANFNTFHIMRNVLFFFNELLKSAMKNRNKQINHLPGLSVTRAVGMIWLHSEAAQ